MEASAMIVLYSEDTFHALLQLTIALAQSEPQRIVHLDQTQP